MAIGKVIKSQQDPVVGEPAKASRPGLVKAEEYEARNTAASILQEAQNQAEQILQQAQAERERVLQDAEAEKQALFEEVKQQAKQKGLAEMTELLVKAKLHADALIDGAESEMVSLAVKIAEKILGRDLQRSPELLVDLCAQAIESVRQAQIVTVRVHPEHAQTLRENAPKLVEALGATRTVSIKEDPEVTGGGCVLETPIGTVDAQLLTQLQVLQQALLESDSDEERSE